eukprot:8336900-Alexandrium_andersonii.AAC.1
MGYFNAQFGLVRVPSGVAPIESIAVCAGPNVAVENALGMTIRLMLGDLGLCLPHLAVDCPPSFHSGTGGHTSRIDFIALPLHFWLGKLGVGTACAAFEWCDAPTAMGIPWDRDAVTHCLLHGERRQAFFDSLRRSREVRAEQWAAADRKHSLTQFYSVLLDAMREPAQYRRGSEFESLRGARGQALSD